MSENLANSGINCYALSFGVANPRQPAQMLGCAIIKVTCMLQPQILGSIYLVLISWCPKPYLSDDGWQVSKVCWTSLLKVMLRLRRASHGKYRDSMTLSTVVQELHCAESSLEPNDDGVDSRPFVLDSARWTSVFLMELSGLGTLSFKASNSIWESAPVSVGCTVID